MDTIIKIYRGDNSLSDNCTLLSRHLRDVDGGREEVVSYSPPLADERLDYLIGIVVRRRFSARSGCLPPSFTRKSLHVDWPSKLNDDSDSGVVQFSRPDGRPRPHETEKCRGTGALVRIQRLGLGTRKNCSDNPPCHVMNIVTEPLPPIRHLCLRRAHLRCRLDADRLTPSSHKGATVITNQFKTASSESELQRPGCLVLFGVVHASQTVRSHLAAAASSSVLSHRTRAVLGPSGELEEWRSVSRTREQVTFRDLACDQRRVPPRSATAVTRRPKPRTARCTARTLFPVHDEHDRHPRSPYHDASYHSSQRGPTPPWMATLPGRKEDDGCMTSEHHALMGRTKLPKSPQTPAGSSLNSFSRDVGRCSTRYVDLLFALTSARLPCSTECGQSWAYPASSRSRLGRDLAGSISPVSPLHCAGGGRGGLEAISSHLGHSYWLKTQGRAVLLMAAHWDEVVEVDELRSWQPAVIFTVPAETTTIAPSMGGLVYTLPAGGSCPSSALIRDGQGRLQAGRQEMDNISRPRHGTACGISRAGSAERDAGTNIVGFHCLRRDAGSRIVGPHPDVFQRADTYLRDALNILHRTLPVSRRLDEVENSAILEEAIWRPAGGDSDSRLSPV
ncbi:hypothetical protein C8Q74DRAFT_1220307 [Fomes fomentarius]|nr:hypothetical protein C8Q74DRAFT_1220305 [Fomes fomentarius]KAI0762289.1 hypothetical protein C8Q74DRAFT_1220307 [Fomes fomentarius]